MKLADDYDPAAGTQPLETPQKPAVAAATAYGADLSWPAVAGATDYDYAVVRPDGRIVAEGKTWEPRVHLGGLAGKTVGGHGYYNVRIRANYCNYDASKNETAPVPSSEWAPSVQLALAASSAEVYFEDDFSWISPDSGSALLKTNTDWINTYCTTDTMVRLDILLNEGSVTLNGWGYDATNKSVYTRPGYIHINSSKALGTLISPAFSAIDDTRDVVVSFDATYFYQYFSKTAETGRNLTVTLRGSGRIEGATDGVLTLTLARGNAWEGFSFRIAGADATTQLLFTPASAARTACSSIISVWRPRSSPATSNFGGRSLAYGRAPLFFCATVGNAGANRYLWRVEIKQQQHKPMKATYLGLELDSPDRREQFALYGDARQYREVRRRRSGRGGSEIDLRGADHAPRRFARTIFRFALRRCGRLSATLSGRGLQSGISATDRRCAWRATRIPGHRQHQLRSRGRRVDRIRRRDGPGPGASALELNIFIQPVDAARSSQELERLYVTIAQRVCAEVKIPVSVKLAMRFTNVVAMAAALESVGVKGAVLFNRFFEPDVDVEADDLRRRVALQRSVGVAQRIAYDGYLRRCAAAYGFRRFDGRARRRGGGQGASVRCCGRRGLHGDPPRRFRRDRAHE